MLLGPDGKPARHSGVVRPGEGGILIFDQTTVVEFTDGQTVKFEPGSVVLIQQPDFERLLAVKYQEGLAAGRSQLRDELDAQAAN